MIFLNQLRRAGVLLISLLSVFADAQQPSAQPKLPVNKQTGLRTVSLPSAVEGARYQYQLPALGGDHATTWILERGTLPKGVQLMPQGLIAGTPGEVGEFHFSVIMHYPGRAAENRLQLTLFVAAPLFARWERYPKINGQRIEGSIKVSNPTAYDYDLTFITVAVNEIGRAQALGYQHFNLRKSTTDFELPFGENVPSGSYKVHVDVVAEVAATHSIHRQHLETKERLVLQPSP
jgi:hypothetical protein